MLPTPYPTRAPTRRSTFRIPPLAPERRAARLCRLARAIASAAFDVADSEIGRPNRSAARVCCARHTAMYLAHVSFQLTQDAVAREFGRDRTSVGHAVRRIEDRRDDPRFEAKLARLEALAESCLSLAVAGEGE